MGTSENASVKGFLESADKAAKVIKEIVEKDGVIHLFSHLDADGIAAAGIMGCALQRLDAKFRMRIMQWVDEKIIGEIVADHPDLVILTDFGSGYLNLLDEKIPKQKIVILDHHQASGSTDNSNFVQVNPHMHGFDGATDVCGSGVAYFTAKAMDKQNVALSPIAIVGALGDMQDRYDQRKLGGLNEIIVEDAQKANLIKVEKDLTFFGRETRPIHKTIASTTNPFLPGLSGEEDKSLAFVSSLNIDLKNGDKFRALADLNEEEKKRLCSALAEHLLSRGLHYEVTNLIGYIYTLTKEEPSTSLRDAREFAVVLNSTGRMNRPSLGIAVTMGDRTVALEEANEVLTNYRKDINKYLIWVMAEPERFKELENIYVINGEDFVNEKIIGTVASILVSSLPNTEKPIIAFSEVKEEGVVKISARTTDMAVRKGINLGKVMLAATEPLGGKGGGHNIAAGAQVPTDKIEEFVKKTDELVKKQLQGEEIGSNNNS